MDPGDDVAPHHADVAVFGATAGGALAAIAAARGGASVVLIEPGRHIGGMLTGGLSRADVERQEPLIGGLTREVFRELGSHYGADMPTWRFEPHVAEALLVRRLGDAGVALLLEHPLHGVDTRGRRIDGVRLGFGCRVDAAVWVDATYEGDLLAGAGASFAVGRESTSTFGESLAGRREILPNPHQLRSPVDALDGDGALLPGVVPYEAIGLPGHGDGKVQAYCYRLCLTTADDRRPLAAPPGYQRERYVLLERYLASLVRSGARLELHDVLGISQLPRGKVDVNSHGPVSTDLPGGSAGYLDGDAEARARIRDDHRTWAAGLLHFLAHDAVVPAAYQDVVAQYGYPRDEFTSTDGWPHQLYVREGRRLRGEVVLTQADLEAGAVPGDTVALAGYNIDIREVQWVACPVPRFPRVHREVLLEGYHSSPVPSYGIPYRALLPRRSEIENLLVSTCLSSSAVAFASLRMEPQFMLAGHAAGIAAAMAARDAGSVHDVDVGRLRRGLRGEGQILS
jgi:hypothetical protein